VARRPRHRGRRPQLPISANNPDFPTLHVFMPRMARVVAVGLQQTPVRKKCKTCCSVAKESGVGVSVPRSLGSPSPDPWGLRPQILLIGLLIGRPSLSARRSARCALHRIQAAATRPHHCPQAQTAPLTRIPQAGLLRVTHASAPRCRVIFESVTGLGPEDHEGIVPDSPTVVLRKDRRIFSATLASEDETDQRLLSIASMIIVAG